MSYSIIPSIKRRFNIESFVFISSTITTMYYIYNNRKWCKSNGLISIGRKYNFDNFVLKAGAIHGIFRLIENALVYIGLSE